MIKFILDFLTRSLFDKFLVFTSLYIPAISVEL